MILMDTDAKLPGAQGKGSWHRHHRLCMLELARALVINALGSRHCGILKQFTESSSTEH